MKGEHGGSWDAATHARLYPKNFNKGLADFIVKELAPVDFLEFGSGTGVLANAIAEGRDLQPSFCIEPKIAAPVRRDKGLNLLNLDIFEVAVPQVLNRKFDLVFSIEVAEHIPLANHEALFDFLAERAGRCVLFSGARPGQGGHGHIAERPEEEWRGEFTARDFVFDEHMTLRARSACDQKNINHRRNVMIFRAPDKYAELDEIEQRARPYLSDLLGIVLSSGKFLVGNLFYVDIKGAKAGMPADSLRPKRLNLLRRSAAAANILEIGFNAGHSALLMLLANSSSKLTVVDLLDRPYASECFDYLNAMFPGRLSLVAGDSRNVLAGLAPESFDLIHYDGGKERTILSDLTATRALVTDDHVLVIDDTQNQALDSAVSDACTKGELSLDAFASDNCAGASRKWKHKLGRFEPRPDRAERVLRRVQDIYAASSFPSIYIGQAEGERLPGYARAENLVAIVRDIENRGLQGAFVEVGVAAGHSSVIAALASSKFLPRDFHLFDTFEGFGELPEEVDFKGRSIRSYDLARYRSTDCSLEAVCGRMLAAGLDPARLFLVKGDVCLTAPQFAGGPISVLRLDADLYAPTLAALTAFYDKIEPGGWLIVDDYGHWQGCRKAVDELFAGRGMAFAGKAVDYTCFVMQRPA